MCILLCLTLHSLNMPIACFSEGSVLTSKTTRCHNPQVHSMNNPHRGKVKPYCAEMWHFHYHGEPVSARHVFLDAFVQLVTRGTTQVLYYNNYPRYPLFVLLYLTNRSDQTNNDHMWISFPPPPKQNDPYDLYLMEERRKRQKVL